MTICRYIEWTPPYISSSINSKLLVLYDLINMQINEWTYDMLIPCKLIVLLNNLYSNRWFLCSSAILEVVSKINTRFWLYDMLIPCKLIDLLNNIYSYRWFLCSSVILEVVSNRNTRFWLYVDISRLSQHYYIFFSFFPLKGYN
jgi:hypothetical protein